MDLFSGTNRSGNAAGRSEEAREEALQQQQAQRDAQNERRRTQRQAAAAAARGDIDSAESDDEILANGHHSRPATPATPAVMEFDKEDGTDPTDVHNKTQNLKLTFDKSDVRFFFIQFEMHLEHAGVKSQWRKRNELHKILMPTPGVIDELKDMLSKGKATAGSTPYKDLKDRLVELYGPKPADAYRIAKKLQRVGKPSQFAKKLINILCPNHPNLDCCLEGTVTALWQDQLPEPVLHQVAGHRLGGDPATMKATLSLADVVYETSQKAGAVAAVRPAVTPAPAGPAPAPAPAPAGAPANFSDIDSLAAHFQAEIAAFRGYTRGQQRGSGRGQFNPRAGPQGRRPPPVRNPKPHPDGPPPNSCVTHWNHGRGAYSCAAKDTCPWKDILTTRPRRQ